MSEMADTSENLIKLNGTYNIAVCSKERAYLGKRSGMRIAKFASVVKIVVVSVAMIRAIARVMSGFFTFWKKYKATMNGMRKSRLAVAFIIQPDGLRKNTSVNCTKRAASPA